VSYFAAAKAGAILVPAPYWYKATEHAHVLRDSGAGVLIAAADHGDVVNEARSGLTPLRAWCGSARTATLMTRRTPHSSRTRPIRSRRRDLRARPELIPVQKRDHWLPEGGGDLAPRARPAGGDPGGGDACGARRRLPVHLSSFPHGRDRLRDPSAALRDGRRPAVARRRRDPRRDRTPPRHGLPGRPHHLEAADGARGSPPPRSQLAAPGNRRLGCDAGRAHRADSAPHPARVLSPELRAYGGGTRAHLSAPRGPAERIWLEWTPAPAGRGPHRRQR
jgi:hypothetical protein